MDENLETFDIPEGTKEKREWKEFVDFCSTPVMSDNIEYNDKGKEKYPSQLHDTEIEALKVLIEMAKGNMHCRQTDKRKNSIKVIERMIEG